MIVCNGKATGIGHWESFNSTVSIWQNFDWSSGANKVEWTDRKCGGAVCPVVIFFEFLRLLKVHKVFKNKNCRILRNRKISSISVISLLRLMFKIRTLQPLLNYFEE